MQSGQLLVSDRGSSQIYCYIWWVGYLMFLYQLLKLWWRRSWSNKRGRKENAGYRDWRINQHSWMKPRRPISYCVRSEVLTALKMTMLFFWVVTPCGLVGRYQHFGETYCLHFQDRPEHGDSMFNRNFGIYLRVHAAPQPRRTVSPIVSDWHIIPRLFHDFIFSPPVSAFIRYWRKNGSTMGLYISYL
jgi:hypothetical protein